MNKISAFLNRSGGRMEKDESQMNSLNFGRGYFRFFFDSHEQEIAYDILDEIELDIRKNKERRGED